ncbi:response regulator [Dolichospermum sp. LEGE 00240]|jgi:signal transduction histidine kinase/DNA-binding NarL/FixJ family response regulator|uniref:ATP-binding protein n=1 Tax=Dolichospermum sp. LEGE 00240 TaxID=1828603 RepID=UPI00188109A8|nr:ATP-binding protein [Dolichospermum sp. LEGE 00240]MDM3848196.1 ATP-binding protein [Aphanizomenon gracile PMC638.10]MDM3849724.1 ATP-binding protein [Aphanizomenon gracile PMC627.10]MDM3854756.1 ATP-binding protein [Aphanizomenon gracile PMC649.10]MDM3859242.1 ATP-binding protein [Aphanizomenon gracile PMC644.10]MBE9251704.1 response regulator [Dolichospermum sp. LEGE 00240]
MLQYPLYEFIATVPMCWETNTLAAALAIFVEEQCDRLVIVNSQQRLIGVLYSARLLPQFLAAEADNKLLNLQQPLSQVDKSLIEPIQTISAATNLEDFSLVIKHQETQQQSNLDWALIDSDGKYLGILNTLRLLTLLAQKKIFLSLTKEEESHKYATNTKTSQHQKNIEHTANKHQPKIHKSIVHLLAKLPWPIMLQTSQGEVVTQNIAWWQQLGALKDPEGIRKQVETILTPKYIYANPQENHKPDTSTRHRQRTSPSAFPFLQESPLPVNNGSNHCVLDTQLGICTCVVEIKTGQERVWQFAKIALDSNELKIWVSKSELPENSEELWLILATDVTEQQQLCKELAAKNADLIQLNRLKDEFLACISHELKTPLTAVLGLSRLLVDQQLGQLNERQARYAGLIHQSGRHLMSVVNDILDLTRMETGQMELTLTPVQIQVVCERAFSDVKNIHHQTNKAKLVSPLDNQTLSNHQFSLAIEPDLEEMVADELRLRQMLVHLLSNAFKFTEISGEIGLRVSRWEGWIAFTVWDTGIGIPEQQQHLIFQKFQQLENPLTRQFEGTGLGLVLTRALARLHGGDVSFLSREGKGSQFTLLLPPSPPKASCNESEDIVPKIEVGSVINSSPQNLNSSSQRLVLVVEAVAQYIEELTEQLKGLGYRVVIARSGTEALEKARRLQPKAIFLNPLLPLLSGWDVMTLLKSDVLTRHIHVIVTATAAEKEQAFTKQADGFLSLPIKHQPLALLLEKISITSEFQHSGLENNSINSQNVPLRILRLVHPELEVINLYPSLREHRVIEVDDLDQADLLARVWQFDVILLDMGISTARTYLQQLNKHQRLATLPLVTCDVATTLAASQIPGLSVFPCLSPLTQEDNNQNYQQGALSSVLQIAAGICCPINILVVDINMLSDLPKSKRKPIKDDQSVKNYFLNFEDEQINRGYEWFQALIQYLQTAGFRASIASCWSEVVQQVSHKSVDLLLICWQETAINKEVQKAIESLGNLQLDLPPILILDQKLNEPNYGNAAKSRKPKYTSSVETAVRGIATQILPRSISMEDLLIQINQSLTN